MNPARQALLAARLTLQLAGRRRRLEAMQAAGRAPISVLFYHRVAKSAENAWTITERRFRQHIDYCQRHFEFVGLDEVQRRLRLEDSPRAAVALTFDDGYAENLDDALPLLIERKLPCTYFVSNEHIRSQTPFPHDRSAGKPLRVNTIAQLRELAAAGIEIGCHTRNHVDFATLDDPSAVKHEIVDAKDELQQWIGKPVRYFAFPYGMPAQLTQLAIDTVQQAGFDGFCSAYGDYNLIGDHAFHIRRIHGDPQMVRLRNWLTFDERKVQQRRQLSY